MPAPLTRCRLIINEPHDGAWNTAADEVLLEQARPTDQPTLRLYRWTEPTLSLGYFQRYEDRFDHRMSRSCPCVRRQSGGGAIIHDHELTYSLVVPGTARWAKMTEALYNQVHTALVDLYRMWGGDAELCTAERRDDFLCFQRRSVGDILIGNHKVTGSAQRRHRQVVLQHGSILLGRSPAAPELPGIEQLTATNLPFDRIVEDCEKKLAEALDFELVPSGFDASEISHIDRVAQSKFSRDQWTKRR